MSETLNKAIAFLDAAIAELDNQTRPPLDRPIVEQQPRRSWEALAKGASLMCTGRAHRP